MTAENGARPFGTGNETTITLTHFQRNHGEYVWQAQAGAVVVCTRQGKPAVVLMSAEEYERLLSAAMACVLWAMRTVPQAPAVVRQLDGGARGVR